MTQLLAGVGILTRIDGKQLALYRDTWSMYRESMKKLSEQGVTLYTDNGNPIQNPYVAISHRTRADMLKMLDSFGMNPSARTKIHAAPTGPMDELSLFLGSESA